MIISLQRQQKNSSDIEILRRYQGSANELIGELERFKITVLKWAGDIEDNDDID